MFSYLLPPFTRSYLQTLKMAKAETARKSEIKKVLNVNTFLNTCCSKQKTLFRNIEKVSIKLIAAKWRLIFNRACLKENLMPSYIINIYIYILAVPVAASLA